MVKTRSQILHVVVKKEECEEKLRTEKLLHGTRKTLNNKTNVTKYKPSGARVVVNPRFASVKLEEVNDSKLDLPSALTSSTATPVKPYRKAKITNEQIANLIGYIVNDKMSVGSASKKAAMSASAAEEYYQEYQNDPEHKVPLTKSGITRRQKTFTQKDMDDVVHYIVKDKLDVKTTSKKMNMPKRAIRSLYAKYKRELAIKQSAPYSTVTRPPKSQYTYKQVKTFIGYIVKDKLTITAAAKKAGMSFGAARTYYLKYLEDPNRMIPVPGNSYPLGSKKLTNDKVKKMIDFIVNDGMSVCEVALKVNLCTQTVRKYYKQYLDDPNRRIPTPENNKPNHTSKQNKSATLDQMKKFFHYIIVDKLRVSQASRKINISEVTGNKYYKKYLEYPSNKSDDTNTWYTVEKMEKVVKYIQKDKMSIRRAAHEANMSYESALKYYRQYSNDPQHRIPVAKNRQYSHDDIKKLISYIEHENMSVQAAAKKINMSNTSACRYYKLYKKDPEHNIPKPMTNGHTIKNRIFDQYSLIIADLYRKKSDFTDIDIKHEPLELDFKKTIKRQEEFGCLNLR